MSVGTRIGLPGNGTSWSITWGHGEVYVCKSHIIYVVDSTLIPRVYAGSSEGDLDGPRMEARFKEPHGLCWSPSGLLHFCSRENHKIKYIENDIVHHFAGSGEQGRKDGPKLAAEFSRPYGMTEHNGSFYITDWNDTIRVISPSGMVSTIGTGELRALDGSFTEACFRFPAGVCPGIDNNILVAESTGCSIRSINLDSETVTTFVGGKGEDLVDGPVADARFGLMRGIVCLPNGDVYVCDRSQDEIRLISNGEVRSLLPTSRGKTREPLFSFPGEQPSALCFAPNGDLWFCETEGFLVRLTNVIPPFGAKTDTFEDFTCLLDSALFPADLLLPHDPSMQSFEFHSYILALNSDVNLGKLTNGLRSTGVTDPGTVKCFRSLLYGSLTPTSTQSSSAALVLQLMELALDCQVPNISQWLENEFWRYCEELGRVQLNELVALYLKIPANHHVELIAQRIITATLFRMRGELGSRLRDWKQSSISDLLQQLIDGSIIPPKREHSEHLDPTDILNQSLKQMVKPQTNMHHASTSSSFRLSISDKPESERFVAPWVLYSRWPYFRRMMHSGMTECALGAAELPAHLPTRVLDIFLVYLHCGELPKKPISVPNCTYILSNGDEFDILDLEGNPNRGFHSLIRRCTTDKGNLSSV